MTSSSPLQMTSETEIEQLAREAQEAFCAALGFSSNWEPFTRTSGRPPPSVPQAPEKFFGERVDKE